MIFGDHFATNCTVSLRWEETVFPRRPVVERSPTHLVITPNLATNVADWAVEVVNPDGARSGEFPFKVAMATQVPILTAVRPNPVTGSDEPQTLILSGEHLIPRYSVRLWPSDKPPTSNPAYHTITSPNGTQAVIQSVFGTAGKTWHVDVVSLAGHSSGRLSFEVQAPDWTPTIHTITPAKIVTANGPQTLSVTGARFVEGARVKLTHGRSGQTQEIESFRTHSSRQLLFDHDFGKSDGEWLLQVVNSKGRSSEPLAFRVNAPAPAWVLWNGLVMIVAVSLLAGLTITLAWLQLWLWPRRIRQKCEVSVWQERQRLFQELHDGVGSELSEITSHCQRAEYELNDPPVVVGRLREIADASRRVGGFISDATWANERDSAPLDELVAYLKERAKRILRHSAIQLRFETPDNLDNAPFPILQGREIILWVTEALHNVLKHAQANEVRLILRWMEKPLAPSDRGQSLHCRRQLELGVTDNGQGIPVEQTSSFGQGQRSLRERAERLGGKFDVHSTPGQGTRVTLTLHWPPMQPREMRDRR